MPLLSAYFQTGGLVDAVLNLGLPAPIDVQVSGSDMQAAHDVAAQHRARRRGALPGVSDVLLPQDIDYPSLQLDIDRVRASELGLSEKEVVGNVITALTSNGMIAPSYWVDPKSGNDYMLTVQYPENYHQEPRRPARRAAARHQLREPTRLDTVSSIRHIESPTEVDHYQLRRVIDVYVSPAGEDLSARAAAASNGSSTSSSCPRAVRVTVRGSVQAMRTSFSAFGFGLILATLLVYLILVAQFQSFLDPLLILLAVPTGLTGVLLILFLTGTTLNVMSLMGVVMMVGHRRLQQHSHRRIHQPPAPRRPGAARSGVARLPRASAPGADDLAGDPHRADPDGAEAGHRQRGLRAAGARHHRRPGGVGRADRVHRAGRLLPRAPPRGRAGGA